MPTNTSLIWTRIPRLCAGKPEALTPWVKEGTSGLKASICLILLGGAAYGASIGLWRGPLQGLYTAIKFPLLLILVGVGNALLNGLLALLLGVPLRMRESLNAIFMSFSLISVILGALSPVFVFILFNIPQLEETGGRTAYILFVLFHVAAIALAGITAHLRLFDLLNFLAGNRKNARTVLICWLSGNLLLGAQLSWNLRPFFGSPDIEVQFLRPNAFESNFFEALYSMSHTLTTPKKATHD